MPKRKPSTRNGPHRSHKPPLARNDRIKKEYMMPATMPIIMLSIMNATRRKSQWLISNCELLPVVIFSSLPLFQRNSLLSLALFTLPYCFASTDLHSAVSTMVLLRRQEVHLARAMHCSHSLFGQIAMTK